MASKRLPTSGHRFSDASRTHLGWLRHCASGVTVLSVDFHLHLDITALGVQPRPILKQYSLEGAFDFFGVRKG